GDTGRSGGAERWRDRGELRREFLEKRGAARSARRTGRRGRAGGARGAVRHCGHRADRIIIFRGRLEQRDVHGWRGEKPEAKSAAVAGDGHGDRAGALYLVQFCVPDGAAAAWRSTWSDGVRARYSIRGG